MPQTHLYLIVCPGDEPGDDFDRIVEADSVEQALRLWRSDDLNEGMEPAAVYRLPALTGEPRYLHWAKEGHVEKVA